MKCFYEHRRDFIRQFLSDDCPFVEFDYSEALYIFNGLWSKMSYYERKCDIEGKTSIHDRRKVCGLNNAMLI